MIAAGDITKAFAACRRLSPKQWARITARAPHTPDTLFRSARIEAIGPRFEFVDNPAADRSSDLPLFVDGDPTLINVVCLGYSSIGDIVDIVAWMPSTGQLRTWLGAAWALGAEQAFYPRLSDGLAVHRSVWNWLAADREGIVLIDPRAAASHLVAAGGLIAEDEEHRKQLERDLTRRPPPISIRRKPTVGEAA